MGTYIGSKPFKSIYLYIKCQDIDAFTESYNYSGPSGEFEKLLTKKIEELTKKHDLPEDIVEYSFPIEQVDDIEYDDITPDYTYYH